jgi:hypothetical protein
MLRVGDVLFGDCSGHFGESYCDKRIEALGRDWIVAREQDTGKLVFADMSRYIGQGGVDAPFTEDWKRPS